VSQEWKGDDFLFLLLLLLLLLLPYLASNLEKVSYCVCAKEGSGGKDVYP